MEKKIKVKYLGESKDEVLISFQIPKEIRKISKVILTKQGLKIS